MCVHQASFWLAYYSKCSSNVVQTVFKQEAPKLLKVVEQTSFSALLYFSTLIDWPVMVGSEDMTTVMMGRFVPEVFGVLAEVRAGRWYICPQLTMECVCTYEPACRTN
jgi:hypothetical protein